MNKLLAFLVTTLLCSTSALAANTVMVQGIPVDFILFGLTLLGVAIFHSHTLQVAVTGAAVIALYKIALTGFKTGEGLIGFGLHVEHEWVLLANLLCLLTGFAILSRHFEQSHVPEILPRYMPSDWKGGFVLLIMVFVMSAFLDNIAAALIGGAMAQSIFKGKVHIGYLAAIVAASNAGGSGSVVGDTTTTMMWISGISPLEVVHAYVAAIVTLLVVGVIGAKQQHAYAPIVRHGNAKIQIDWGRLFIVGVILVLAFTTNVTVNMNFKEAADHFPFIGVAVWVAILVTAGVRRHDWAVMPEAFKGAVFLLSLVLCASMMPVEELPPASWYVALGLGFLSAVFDNIPLTALAIKQGGYDWGVLAFTVGFGGSMVWFGSSAGVALSNMYPEARSFTRWVTQGWHVVLAYVLGFFVMMAVVGWQPHVPLTEQGAMPAASHGVATTAPASQGQGHE
jgi:Na+/H+ antiporter NhaD/arsenite permease-like protein